MKKAYRYNAETFEFLGETLTQLDPLESKMVGEEVYLLPSNCTFEEPFEKREGFVNVWNGQNWEEVEDHRGQLYWLETDTHDSEPKIQKELGTLPNGATLTRPPLSLEEVKLQKVAELKERRNEEEESPITYKGKLWDFDSKSRDRVNVALIALVVNKIETIGWTANDDTTLALSSDDLGGIISMAAARGNNLHTKYRELRDKVNSATTIEEVEAIVW